MKSGFALVALSAVSAVSLFSQSSGPAPVIQIIREAVKEGKTAAHERTEMEFVRAFRKADFPGHYYGFNAISGSNEAWFISVYRSFADSEEYRRISEREPLNGELELADAHDGALRDSTRTMWAVYNKDMSYRPEQFHAASARYVSVGTYRVKLGKEDDLESGAKMLIGAYEKANLPTPFICYRIVAGAPSGTYLFFEAMDSLKIMDDAPAHHKAMVETMGEENYHQFMKGSGDIFQSMEENLLTVNPRMSYVTKAVEDADPAFWRPKPPVKKAPEAAPKQKAGK